MQRSHLKPSKADRSSKGTMVDLSKSPGVSTSQHPDDALWSIKIVMTKTGLSRATIYNYVTLGLFPRQRKLGPGRVAWRASDVCEWIESRPQ